MLTSAGPAASDDTGAGGESRRGRIVDAPANIRRFAPEEQPADGSLNSFDPRSFDLRWITTQLSPEAAEWYQHVQALSDPFFEGRAPGTRGMELAAEYVEFHFRRVGLHPVFASGESTPADAWTSYRQPVTIPGQRVEVREASVAINQHSLEHNHDFAVLGNSGTAHAEAAVTFVGYGIVNGPDGYSSFEDGTDLSGRIALLLRYEPLDVEGRSRWSPNRWSPHSAIVGKLMNLAQRGAAGIVLVNPPGATIGSTGLESPQRSQFGGDFSIPIVQLSQEAADRLLAAGDREGRDLSSLRRLADEGAVKCIDLDAAVRVRLATAVDRSRIPTDNIGGVVRGAGVLAGQWIIVGAHYDHLGYGHFGSAEGEKGRDKLHPGADDNASGTAGLITLARRTIDAYASPDAPRDRRSVLFLAFTAEESGLQGSRYFVQHPPMPMSSVNLMMNMDMIGRLRGGQVLVTGTGTAQEFDSVLRGHFEASGLTAAVSPGGPGPSDHTNFFNAGVPVLMFNTGLHDEYHSPQDVAWTVNPTGAIRVLDLMHAILHDVACRPDPLTFVRNRQGGGGAPTGARVRLGIMPVYEAEGVTGVLVDNVFDGTTAAEAGIQAGDVLISWNGRPLERGRDLNERLQEHKPGDVVTIGLTRDGSTIEVKATLKAGGGRGRPPREPGQSRE